MLLVGAQPTTLQIVYSPLLMAGFKSPILVV